MKIILLLSVTLIINFSAFSQRNYYAFFSELRPQINSENYLIFLDNIAHTTLKEQYQKLDSLAIDCLSKQKYLDYLFYKNQLAQWYFDNYNYEQTYTVLENSRGIFKQYSDTLNIEFFQSYSLQSYLIGRIDSLPNINSTQYMRNLLEFSKKLGYHECQVKDNPYINSLEAVYFSQYYYNKDTFFYYADELRNACEKLDYSGGLLRLDNLINMHLYMIKDLETATETGLRVSNIVLKPELKNPNNTREQKTYLYNNHNLGVTYFFNNQYKKALPHLKYCSLAKPNASTINKIIEGTIFLAACCLKLNDTAGYNKQVEQYFHLTQNVPILKINLLLTAQNFTTLIAESDPELCHAIIDSMLIISKDLENFQPRLSRIRAKTFFYQKAYRKIIELYNEQISKESIFKEYMSDADEFFWIQYIGACNYHLWQETKKQEYFYSFENYLIEYIKLYKEKTNLTLASHEQKSINSNYFELIKNYLLIPYSNGCGFIKINDSIIINALLQTKLNTIGGSTDRIQQISLDEKSDVIQTYSENLKEIQKQKIYLNKLNDSLIKQHDVISFNELLYNNARLRNQIKKHAELESNNNMKITKIPDVKSLQKLLSKEQALIDYYVIDSAIFITLITKDTVCLTHIKEKNINELIASFIYEIKTGNLNNKIISPLSSLLLEKIKPLIANKTHLIIIPHKQLSKIPFEALCYSEEPNELLIDKFNIVYSYSSHVWFNNNKNSIVNNNKSLLALAPLFNNIGDKPLQVNETILIRDGYRGATILNPLPYSENEFEQIKNIYKKNDVVFSGFKSNDATKQNLYDNYKNHSIIHFATHGLENKDYFERSGIFLYQDDSCASSTINLDNFLSLGEIYALESQPDLVVLSACKTGTGKIVEGEGVMALPRGFIYAGVPNVIASLWKVHDEKTKDLMVAFYKHLLEDKVSYAEALRRAKLDCIEKGFLPVDWAGFVLIGN